MPSISLPNLNFDKIREYIATHAPESPSGVLNLGAGLSSLVGQSHDLAKAQTPNAGIMDHLSNMFSAGKNLAKTQLQIKDVPAHTMPHELLTAYEEAMKAGKPNEAQRLVKGLAEVTGTTPAGYDARRKALTDAMAAERSAKDTRRTLALAGLGGLGLVGAAAALNRHSEDPDTYKHSSELGWRPRQKTAAPGDTMSTLGELESQYPAQYSAARRSTGGVSQVGVPAMASATRANLAPAATLGGLAQMQQTQPEAYAAAQRATGGVSSVGVQGMMDAVRGNLTPMNALRNMTNTQMGQYRGVLNQAGGFTSPGDMASRAVGAGLDPFRMPPAAAQAAPAARAPMARARPSVNFGGQTDADIIAAAQRAAQGLARQGGVNVANRGAAIDGTRSFNIAQARRFLERNPLAARGALAGNMGPRMPAPVTQPAAVGPARAPFARAFNPYF